MVPELLVADLARSRQFYVDVLGFTPVFDRDDPPFAYLSFGEAQLMLEQDHDTAWTTGPLAAPRGRGMNLQIEVPDVASIRDRLLSAEIVLFRELRESQYDTASGVDRQLEFLVQDPDGYLLRFSEPLPSDS